MPGGLLTLAAIGAENIFLNGNPSKTFFKAKYNKYTNFGMQRFRIDYVGNREVNFTRETEYTFIIPRYADMLHDTYFVIELPDIWSTIYYPDPKNKTNSNNYDEDGNFLGGAYEFKWIENMGTEIIKQVSIYGGGQVLAQYSGEFLNCLKERDFSSSKKELWDRMTGNISELNSPAVNDIYPSCIFKEGKRIEPSIRGRKLYIPIEAWFSVNNKCALPLVAIQYTEISIKITLRPVREWYIIRDVQEFPYFPYISPIPTKDYQNIKRFINPPQKTPEDYSGKKETWAADIHLISNYIFLDIEEQHWFSKTEHKYLVKQIFEYDYLNIVENVSVQLNSRDLVSDYMWRFRRNDASQRNEWANYTNWPYKNKPFGPSYNEDTPLNFPVFSKYHPENKKEIMKNMSLVLDGDYREVQFDSGLYNYVEKWLRCKTNPKDYLYTYCFCLDSNFREYQPSGAQNMSMFKTIQLKFEILQPPFDASGVNLQFLCDDVTGEIIGMKKNNEELYQYTYDLRIFESRYNIITIVSGRIGLLYAR